MHLHDNILYFDFETYSTIDLKEIGAHEYSKHWSTGVLCLALVYKKEFLIWYPHTKLDKKWLKIINDKKILKVAHNIQFDLLIWNNVFVPKYLKKLVKKLTWNEVYDSMASCYYYSLPGALEKACTLMKIGQSKHKIGRRAMLELTRKGLDVWASFNTVFNIPLSKEIKKHLSQHSGIKNFENKLTQTALYCLGDVQMLKKLFEKIGMIDNLDEIKYWQLTNEINDRGVKIDRTNVKLISDVVNKFEEGSEDLIKKYSKNKLDRAGLNSSKQFKEYFESLGYFIENVQKQTLENFRGSNKNKNLKHLVDMRISLSKSSIAKIASMYNTSKSSGRSHGLLQYYGAHTGRWSGRLIQPQNFPRDVMDDKELSKYLKACKQFLKSSKTVSIEDLNLINESSRALRKFLIADRNHTLIVSDYRQIEARVLAWLACQMDLVFQFKKGDDIYQNFANDIRVSRDVGKMAILGLGYGMGYMKFRDQVEKEAGVKISDRDASDIVHSYRTKFYKIKQFWYLIENVFKKVSHTKKSITVDFNIINTQLIFQWDKKIKGVAITLPSKRKLYYPFTEIEDNDLYYIGARMGVITKVYLYGGILVENLIQAIARDIMSYCMAKVKYKTIFTVHDEIVWEVTKQAFKTKKDLDKLTTNIVNRYCPEWFDKELLAVKIEKMDRYGK